MAEARKTVTVVFSDVAGSTNLGERLDPEAVRYVMGRWFGEAAIALERHGGTVEKFIGDAVMAVFGIPKLREDDALRAVRAAGELHERIAGLNGDLERELGVTIALRTGVNTGEVVAGDPAQGQAFATGDAVNVAARLQQTAAPGEIVLGETTFALVRGAVRAEPLEPLELKGKAEPVGALRLLEVFAGAPAFTRRLSAPFVGRGDELAALVAALDEADREGACRLVTVVGAPGIGKSRLVRELLTVTKGRARAVIGRCLSYGEGITYWPLAEIVRQVGGEDPRSVVAQLVGGEDGELVGERVAGAVGLTETVSRTEEIFWAARRLFESLARERPLVVVVDDIHWAEETLLDLLEYVTAFARAPVLLVCAARPDLFDERPSWPAPRPGSTLVSLEPLTEAESEELLEGLGAAAGVASHVVEAAEGNPLFLEQLLALEAENGREAGRPATPATIQALIGARIDRLEENERTVLERAAVEGRLFHLGAVAELLPDDRRAFAGSSVLSLARKELVRPDESLFPGEDGFRFAHILVRDVAYKGMPKAIRAEAHERFAAWLERKAGVRLTEYEEILAYHLEQAALYGRGIRPGDPRTEALAQAASQRLTATGRRALARGDVRAGANLLERAMNLRPPADTDRLELVVDLFDCYLEAGRLREAEKLLTAAGSDARSDASDLTWAKLTVLQAQLEIGLVPEGWSERALSAAETAIPILEAADDDLSLSRAWELIANVHWLRGELELVRSSAERGLAHAERAGDIRAQAILRMNIYSSAHFGPASLAECRPLLESELEWAHQTGDRGKVGMVLVALGEAEAAQGRFVEGVRLIEEGRALLNDLGLHLTVAGIAANAADVVTDDPAASELEFRRSYELLSKAGEKSYLSTVAAKLAECVLEQGRVEEAIRLVAEAEEAGASDDVTTQVIVAGVRAKVLAQQGEDEEALRLAREAVADASATEYAMLRADALRKLGTVLATTGNTREAEEVLGDAIAAYERKGYTVLADRARARLAELQASSPSQ
jgi:class 3 adenylate cyclase/tetratricopeptide (TPR) repeat protein